MNSRIGVGVRSRDHRRYQFPTDFVSESVAPSSGKDDLSGETIEASCHSCADPSLESVAPSCGKMTFRKKQLKHLDCANLLAEDVVTSSGEHDLSSEPNFPLVKHPVSWLDPGAHTESPSDVGDEKMTTKKGGCSTSANSTSDNSTSAIFSLLRHNFLSSFSLFGVFAWNFGGV